MLKLININKSFQDRKVLTDFTLSVNKNDKILIKGQSGIGKSTIFNLIMGFEYPDSGQLFFNGHAYEAQSIYSIRKNISWLPQNTNIMGSGNISDFFFNLGKLHYNSNINNDKSYLEKQLSILNLEQDVLNKEFANLSGGELQRLGLIICKVLDREILLLDEPTSALDKDTTLKAIEYIIGMNNTIICISHNTDLDLFFNKILELK